VSLTLECEYIFVIKIVMRYGKNKMVMRLATLVLPLRAASFAPKNIVVATGGDEEPRGKM
jgi:hypothetical protein